MLHRPPRGDHSVTFQKVQVYVHLRKVYVGHRRHNLAKAKRTHGTHCQPLVQHPARLWIELSKTIPAPRHNAKETRQPQIQTRPRTQRGPAARPPGTDIPQARVLRSKPKPDARRARRPRNLEPRLTARVDSPHPTRQPVGTTARSACTPCLRARSACAARPNACPVPQALAQRIAHASKSKLLPSEVLYAYARRCCAKRTEGALQRACKARARRRQCAGKAQARRMQGACKVQAGRLQGAYKAHARRMQGA